MENEELNSYPIRDNGYAFVTPDGREFETQDEAYCYWYGLRYDY